jgi:hypothetical protein
LYLPFLTPETKFAEQKQFKKLSQCASSYRWIFITLGQRCSWVSGVSKYQTLKPEHWIGCNWRPTPVKDSPFHERLLHSGSNTVAETWTLLVNVITNITPSGWTKAWPYGPGSLLAPAEVRRLLL